MALRKASAYSQKRARPFTRTARKKGKDYIKTVPFSKVAKFNGGNASEFNQGKYKFIVRLVAEERVQIRDNALEAARMYLTKQMDTAAIGQYFLAVKVYPHHMLRENKTAAGAGADRLSSGMKHSYGIVIGRAALLAPGKEVFFIACATEKAARSARAAMGDIRSKIPGRCRIYFETK